MRVGGALYRWFLIKRAFGVNLRQVNQRALIMESLWLYQERKTKEKRGKGY